MIADDNCRIISLGYNGFPRGVADSEARLNNREIKYSMVVHAERNAMLFAKQDLTGCHLFTWPFPCCCPCAAMVIQTGIVSVTSPWPPPKRWMETCTSARMVLEEAGVRVISCSNFEHQLDGWRSEDPDHSEG